jgi:hypothetical protein
MLEQFLARDTPDMHNAHPTTYEAPLESRAPPLPSNPANISPLAEIYWCLSDELNGYRENREPFLSKLIHQDHKINKRENVK